jgi:hypothetical protein
MLELYDFAVRVTFAVIIGGTAAVGSLWKRLDSAALIWERVSNLVARQEVQLYS